MADRRASWLHSAPAAGDGLNLRRWFDFYLAAIGLMSMAALAGFYAYENSGSLPGRQVWLLGLYGFYLSLCCTFFPAPVAWIILLMASPLAGLFDAQSWIGRWGLDATGALRLGDGLTVVTVALVGAAATTLANLNEYHVITLLLRYGRVHRVRRTRLYRTASRWFALSPFGLILLFSFLPVPVDVVRWLAISNRYGRVPYAAANFLGRFGRYGLMAAAATCLQIGWRGIIAIQLALVGLVLLRSLLRLGRRPASTTDATETNNLAETADKPEPPADPAPNRIIPEGVSP
ncbi:MAG: hypothetical protein JW810_00795 [Sedimentisphaerales bacterium]|nr:hypothetical protein [Sedimentisphaerales bacterium]